MGLIKAALGAAGGVMADQWKEYFYCESMSSDTLVSKSRKKLHGVPQTDTGLKISSATVP